MEFDTVNRAPRAIPTSLDGTAPPSPGLPLRAVDATPTLRRRSSVAPERPSALLLRDAVREAGLFQRSVLGHLDHNGWVDRVQADGQRLIDLLAEIGFVPSDNRWGSKVGTGQ
ncbi:hypothetical protein [Novosphingobium sp. BL-52-GroH]|uniref:hypothetical protein n=1 Tax=Novosphingobium sp. BL-52-GroH TaxID=3349877 RepID=UPI00384C9908